MEVTEKLLATEQASSSQLRAGNDALASDLAAAKAALAAAQSGLDAEKSEAAQLRAELEAIKGAARGARRGLCSAALQHAMLRSALFAACPLTSPPHPSPAGEYVAAGDMLEAEQGRAMALKKSVADAERRVRELGDANSGLNRELAQVT
jgi:septal ring factor EnvC (AmiA/AmiB activator)